MRTQHIIASILLAICGLFIHVSANDIGNGVTDTTTSVGGYSFPPGLCSHVVTSGNVTVCSPALISTQNSSMETVPITLSSFSSYVPVSVSSTAVNTSWTPVTMTYTSVETSAIKPVTRTEVFSKLSTVERTVVTTETFGDASIATRSYVVIVSYSTETLYTSTWLAPPSEIDFTRTVTGITTSEEIVVPTDVTYIVTVTPAAPPSTTGVPSVKRGLTWHFFNGNYTSPVAPRGAAVPDIPVPSSKVDAMETVVIPDSLPTSYGIVDPRYANTTMTNTMPSMNATDGFSAQAIHHHNGHSTCKPKTTTVTIIIMSAPSAPATLTFSGFSMFNTSTLSGTSMFNTSTLSGTNVFNTSTLSGTSMLNTTTSGVHNKTVTFTAGPPKATFSGMSGTMNTAGPSQTANKSGAAGLSISLFAILMAALALFAV